MNPLTRFFHEFFNPHCPQCEMDRQVKNINPVVDVLKSELERSYRNNDILLERLFDKQDYERDLLEKTQINPPAPDFREIPNLSSRRNNWANRRRVLEAQKRAEAIEIARLKQEGITPVTEESLEQELESVNENAG